MAGSCPNTVAVPRVAGISPSRIFMSVLLPAPLAPISPTTPLGMSALRPSSASTPGYCLVRSRKLTIAPGGLVA